MAHKINILDEVETLLGRALTPAEGRRFRQARSWGMANPVDLVRTITA